MARPKTAYPDLPRYVKARPSGDGFLYYYQRNGRQVALGRSYENAEARATSVPPETARVDSLTLEAIVAKAIPARKLPGVYFLLIKGKVAYVGQSADIWVRIAQHMKNRTFDSFSWISCPISELDRMEERCILAFKPWQNDGIKPNFRTRSNSTVSK